MAGGQIQKITPSPASVLPSLPQGVVSLLLVVSIICLVSWVITLSFCCFVADKEDNGVILSQPKRKSKRARAAKAARTVTPRRRNLTLDSGTVVSIPIDLFEDDGAGSGIHAD